jgi:uncharacterized protein YcbX
MTARIQALYRYPVKGLSPERLDRVDLTAGEAVPHDRRFAIAHGAARRLDTANPEWMPKGFFLQLMANEKLAALETSFDPRSGVLTIKRNGRQVSRGNITEPNGRAVIEQFFAAYMGRQARGHPKLVECRGQPFSDTKVPFISLINLASVRDLERVVGRPVDPMRFRGNILIDGPAAWSELDWVGQTVQIGGATVKIAARTGRCAATNVEPGTGTRDLTLPRSMQHAYGHEDCGVYARVTTGASIAVGDPITVAEAALSH